MIVLASSSNRYSQKLFLITLPFYSDAISGVPGTTLNSNLNTCGWSQRVSWNLLARGGFLLMCKAVQISSSQQN